MGSEMCIRDSVNTLQIWQISDFGWPFARTSSSCEHAANLAMGLDMCNSSITGFLSASGVYSHWIYPLMRHADFSYDNCPMRLLTNVNAQKKFC